MINVLILAAGSPPAGSAGADSYPVCLSEMDGVSILERITKNASGLENARYTYAMLDQDVRKFHLDNVVELLTPGAQLVRVAIGTQGAACTALLAASNLDPNSEILVISANELVVADLNEVVAGFRERDLDAGTLVFRSVHPRYSYVRLDDAGSVTEAAQHNPISQHATAGLFWYRRTGDFVEAVKSMIRKGGHVNGQYYICPAFNELLLKQGRIGAIRLDSAQYLPVKTERQLYRFEQVVGGPA